MCRNYKHICFSYPLIPIRLRSTQFCAIHVIRSMSDAHYIRIVNANHCECISMHIIFNNKGLFVCLCVNNLMRKKYARKRALDDKWSGMDEYNAVKPL